MTTAVQTHPAAAAERTSVELTAVALLNCLIRELATPAGSSDHHLAGPSDRHLVVRLPATDTRLRIELSRPACGIPAPTGRAWLVGDPEWAPLDLELLVRVAAAELAAATGVENLTLAGEIESSRQFVAAVLQVRDQPLEQSGEQSLIAGHRFHPAPKARSGPLGEALDYAPEAGRRFRLRYLAVPDELLWQREAAPGAGEVFDRLLDAAAPPGHRLLPVHPWQHAILSRAGALRPGRLVDLGERGAPVLPTSSVRTVDAGAAGFLKLSLSVRLTNCLRINPRPELAAAVALSSLLEPVRADLAERYPGTTVLRETASRTVDLDSSAEAGPDLSAALGVIARESVAGRLPEGVQPVLAAALVEPRPAPGIAALLERVSADRAAMIDWWDAYLDRLVPPVLHAYLGHGVVFEAHLQNVLIGFSGSGGAGGSGSGPGEPARPSWLVLRDLEGAKLVGPQQHSAVAHLPAAVRDHLGYGPERGWQRVAYCLLVNHVGGVLGALAERHAGAEPALWSRVRRVLQQVAGEHGEPAPLIAVLAGGPVPAKANLLTRWRGSADRDSGYLPLRLPLGPS